MQFHFNIFCLFIVRLRKNALKSVNAAWPDENDSVFTAVVMSDIFFRF